MDSVVAMIVNAIFFMVSSYLYQLNKSEYLCFSATDFCLAVAQCLLRTPITNSSFFVLTYICIYFLMIGKFNGF